MLAGATPLSVDKGQNSLELTKRPTVPATSSRLDELAEREHGPPA